MVRIGYFSLLLVFISANIIDGMDIPMFEEWPTQLPSPYLLLNSQMIDDLPNSQMIDDLPNLPTIDQENDPDSGTDEFLESEDGVEFFGPKLAHALLQHHQPNNPFDQQIEEQNNSDFSSLRKKKFETKKKYCSKKISLDIISISNKSQVPLGSLNEFIKKHQHPPTENFATKSPRSRKKRRIDTKIFLLKHPLLLSRNYST